MVQTTHWSPLASWIRYKECDIEHINVFGLVFYNRQLVLCSEFELECAHAQFSEQCRMECHEKTACLPSHHRPFASEQFANSHEPPTVVPAPIGFCEGG